MAISIVQQAKNTEFYPITTLVATLPVGTTASSFLAVVVEAQKTGYPFNVSNLNANTTLPTITDDKGNTYTLVRSIVNQTQETNGVSSPDSAGFYPSLYVYISSGAVTAGTRNIFVSSFYPDELNASPPIGGRPVFDGGMAVQVFELAGVTTGVTASNYGSANVVALGSGLITSSGANGNFVLEAAILVDSATIVPAATATLQDTGNIYGGSSWFMVQTTSSNTGGTVGFTNSLQYTGGVIAVVLV